MTAQLAIEAWSKQTSSIDSPDGKSRTASFTRGFTVQIDPFDPVEEAYKAPGLPKANDVYPGTVFVICRKRSLTRMAPSLVMVMCEYSGSVGKQELSDPPTGNAVRIKWRSSIVDEAIDEDINGKPIVTKNLEPVDGLTERIPSQIAILERDFLSIDTFALELYLRSRNSDEFLGWPAGTCRMMDYSADNEVVDGELGLWKVSATFEFRAPYRTTYERAWWKRVRHEGFLVRDTAGGAIGIAWDERSKAPAAKPILLKEDGTRETDPEEAFWLEFETTHSLSYNALGFL
jgi:hypothetical protein